MNIIVANKVTNNNITTTITTVHLLAITIHALPQTLHLTAPMSDSFEFL